MLHSAIALVFAGSLAACGSDSSSKSTTTPTAAAAATTAAAATSAPATTARTASAAPVTTSAPDPYGNEYPVTTDAPASTVAAAPATTTSGAATAGASSLALATDAKFGPILVDAEGYSMYLFTKDAGTTTACGGGCAKAWPPATVSGAPTVGAGLDTSLVGVAAQADGTMQLTYGGHLLYRFAGDTGPGQVNGQDSNEVWYLVDASGEQVGDS
ncbi:MAG: hypothetical protein ABIR68_08910 [Ilumatobacteraceae bacterium]